MAKNVNILVSDLIRVVCSNLEKHYAHHLDVIKQHKDGNNNNNNIKSIGLIKDSLHSLKIISQLIQEVIANTNQRNTTDQFVEELENKIYANNFIDKQQISQVVDNIKYLEFFKTVHKPTEKNLKLNEWIKIFQVK